MSEPTVNQIILDQLNRIEGKVDSHGQKLASVATDVTNIKKTQDEQDDEIDGIKSRITPLETWKTELKTRVATYAVIVAFVFGLVWDVGKEAVASIFMRGGQ